MTSSLSSFISSLLWGGLIVVLPITTALVLVSRTDKVLRS
nr:photosystem II protein X [Madagascaria erythrocladioides]QUE28928.1 PsbX [Madagascaria erythrocladioides]UNJ16474.1 photosystem II protein X [Madagascaria erythrocladioides]